MAVFPHPVCALSGLKECHSRVDVFGLIVEFTDEYVVLLREQGEELHRLQMSKIDR